MFSPRRLILLSAAVFLLVAGVAFALIVLLNDDDDDSGEFIELADLVGVTALVEHPDKPGEVLVAIQGGQIVSASLDNTREVELFGDVSGLLADDLRVEEGLIGFTFSPTFAEDGRVYLTYTAGEKHVPPGETADNPARTVISRFTVRDGQIDIESEVIILEINQPTNVHNSGQLAFGPDGYLYIAVGDGGNAGDPYEVAQDPEILLGSILRIDVSGEAGYEIPADNPFADGGGAPEVYAHGFRNPWRFSWDSETGNLWVADVGQASREEINRVESGGNYGWDCFEGTLIYEEEDCEGVDVIGPVAEYSHEEGCAVVGGYVYSGSEHPDLDGLYMYADFCTGTLWGLPVRPIGSRPELLSETGLQVTSFGVLASGEVLIASQDAGIYSIPDLDLLLPGTVELLDAAGVAIAGD